MPDVGVGVVGAAVVADEEPEAEERCFLQIFCFFAGEEEEEEEEGWGAAGVVDDAGLEEDELVLLSGDP